MRFTVKSTHRRIQEGDIKEFEKLFRKLYTPLCHFAYRFLKDMDAAEEIVQDLFFNYWKNKEKLEVNISLKSYLYQATKNKCLKAIKHTLVKERYSSAMMKQQAEFDSNSFNSLEIEELNDVIEETLNKLPEKCKQIFILSRFEGLKYIDIANKLSISVKTVEANMGKALKAFRESLKQYDPLTY